MSKSLTTGSLLFFFVKFLVLVTVLVWVWWMYGMPAYTKLLAKTCPALIELFYDEPVTGLAASWEEATAGDEKDLFNTKYVLVWYTEDLSPNEVPPYLFIAKLVTNLPPFLALVLATPALGIWRRIRILISGSLILVATHVAFLIYAFQFVGSAEKGGEITQAASELLLTLPFLLWIVLAYWHKLGGYFSSAPETPLGNDDFELSGAKLLPDEDAPKPEEDGR